MNKRITKHQSIKCRVDSIIKDNDFITWDMLGISEYNVDYNMGFARYNKSDESKIVSEYMEELGYEYVRYGLKFSDKKIHGLKKGFCRKSIAIRRRKKLQRLVERNAPDG
ncbi:hypothetical protein [uncultured Draconibacterium sp.]|uniref:hypothetical protein n=1 Tax=uncultured Draconibacterium sp. TaxID=1573823 RepID=UPI0025E9B879|nr:hypothetical protein [uncultured Draconibacterium sp.]